MSPPHPNVAAATHVRPEPGTWILIIDYGSQYTQLIARRIRQLKVFCEVRPCGLSAQDIDALKPGALILSGGPGSVYAPGAAGIDADIFKTSIPILGICYGQQLMAHALGGRVKGSKRHEYGKSLLRISDVASRWSDDLLGALPKPETPVWMSHGDRIEMLPDGFEVLATTQDCPYAVIAHATRPQVGLQFHPEVSHSPHGMALLEGFVFSIAKLRPTWSMRSFLSEQQELCQDQVNADEQVICALSGGVDSSVVAALLCRALGSRCHCILVDTGLLREQEVEEIKKVFSEALGVYLHVVEARDVFMRALAGVIDPEIKRRRIGHAFIDVFVAEAKRIDNAAYLAQGTLYPDVIESMSAAGGATVIKSHHNVGGLPENMQLKLIEPLRDLFKDEVRMLGEELGLPHHLCYRQPFPGPGLAIRIVGEVTQERLAKVRKADAIVQEVLTQMRALAGIWQAFAVLLPVCSVGVMGDRRTYEETICLRCVDSSDGMTADWSRLPHAVLAEISSQIISQVRGVGRVVYDISSKPPATIEWE